jgi:hypothetical protein
MTPLRDVPVRALGLATLAYGVASLLVPERVVRLAAGRRPRDGEVVAARVLGARVALQGVALAASPVAWVGLVAKGAAAVDGLHAVSMAGLAAIGPRYRRVALVSGVLALASAAALGVAASDGRPPLAIANLITRSMSSS